MRLTHLIVMTFLIGLIALGSTLPLPAEAGDDCEERVRELQTKIRLLENEVEYLRKQLETLSGKPTPPMRTGHNQKEKEGFAFELGAVERDSDGQLTVHLTVTNTQEDRLFHISSNCAVFDNKGKEYRLAASEIAGKKKKGGSKATLIRGVETDVKLYFHDVSRQATTITRLDVRCGVGWESGLIGGPASHFTTEFRNIRIY